MCVYLLIVIHLNTYHVLYNLKHEIDTLALDSSFLKQDLKLSNLR